MHGILINTFTLYTAWASVMLYIYLYLAAGLLHVLHFSIYNHSTETWTYILIKRHCFISYMMLWLFKLKLLKLCGKFSVPIFQIKNHNYHDKDILSEMSNQKR